MPRRTVSLITTVLNEGATIAPLLDSILAQTRQPDEIVICDAGSTDATRDIISQYIADGLPARLIVEPGANRARGRNLSVQQARGDIIVSIDAGCVAERDWLAQLISPFESDEPPDVVAGYYEPDTASPLEDAIGAATVLAPSEVDAETFLPSGRSVAFTRMAWDRVAGYPEHIDYGEDTAFGFRLRAAGCRFLFQPEARVRWRMQNDLLAVFKQFFHYARSDGQLGQWFLHYAKAFVGILSAMLFLILANCSPTSKLGAILFVLLLLGYWTRCTARARRRGADWWPAVLAPGVSLTVDLANAAGYLVGLLRRRPRPRALPTDRALSVAQVTYTYRPIGGGADVYASELAAFITETGHQQRVYQRVAQTDADDVTFVPNPWRGLPFEFWTQAIALFRLWRDLLSHDVVICHYPHYLLALDLMSLFRRSPLRVAISHGVFWDDAPGSLRSAIKCGIAKLAFHRAHLYIANDTHFLRAMGLRISPGQRMFSEVAPGVWFIPNGVDTEEFHPTEALPELRDRSVILVPRNLFRNRGIHLAVEAFADFSRDYPETALLIVGGGGDPRYVAELKQDIAQRGLEDRVVFYGAVSHHQLPAIYSSAQLTLIPSLCGEGTSLSALESMACGTATICTAVAGLLDLPGPHALPIAHSLAETMREVYPRRAGVGEEQRAAVLTHYSIGNWQVAWARTVAGVGIRLSNR
jgi:glycosyltransferase involved in cell wall biosynthesis